MFEKFISVIILASFVNILIFFNVQNKETEDIKSPYKKLEILDTQEEIKSIRQEIDISEDIYTKKCNELLQRQEIISSIEDKKEWFIAYKNLISEYARWCDPPETIYDYYSGQELQLLFSVVEAETTGGNFNSKCNVASVIFNRIAHNDFENSLKEVLIASQFTPIKDGRYKTVEVVEDTILACEYAFSIEDTTCGALYFDNVEKSWASQCKETLFKDEIGHSFYK